MLKKFSPLIFVIIFNLWIWKIFNFNFLIGITVILTTVSLYYKKLTLTILFFILILFLQYKTSSINSLTFLNGDEKIVQEQKMHGYPPVYISLGTKKVYIPVSNWLEARPEILIFYKLQTNISEVVDPNLYFFANHPRERAGLKEYEMFPYILIPFFIFGISKTEKKDLKFLLLSISPLILLSLIGNSNKAGPFSLFPFVANSVSVGLYPIFSNKKYLVIFLIIFTLVFIQVLSYAKY